MCPLYVVFLKEEEEGRKKEREGEEWEEEEELDHLVQVKIHLQMSSDQVAFAINWVRTKLSIWGFGDRRLPFYRWANWGTERYTYSMLDCPTLFPSWPFAQTEIILLTI